MLDSDNNDNFGVKSSVRLKLIEFEIFKKEFEFIYLKGLKGLDLTCQIQEKKTSKLFDYVEMDFKKVEEFDKFMYQCEKLLEFDHIRIMKLYKYSRVFVEDGLSEPYCKFFLIFEYCESSLRNEILHHQKQKRTYRRSALKKILVALAEAIDFLHERRQYHGDLRTEKIFKMETGEYKIMPPRVKPRQAQPSGNTSATSDAEFYFYAPEQYKLLNFRIAYEKPQLDLFKCDIFTIGMIVLHVGIFKSMREVYGKFTMREEKVDEALNSFQNSYGFELTQVLKRCLVFDPRRRIAAPDLVLLLKAEEPAIGGAAQNEQYSSTPATSRLQHQISVDNTQHLPVVQDASGISENRATLTSKASAQKQNVPSLFRNQSLILTTQNKSKNVINNTTQIQQKSGLANLTSQSGKSDKPINVNIDLVAAGKEITETPSSSIYGGVSGNNTGQASQRLDNLGSSDRKQSGFGGALHAATKFAKRFKDPENEFDDADRKIFGKLPQEYQDEIDARISAGMKPIQENYTIEYLQGGHRYQGQRNNGKPHGWGTWMWANGEMYEGQFVNGKYNGIGIYYWPNAIKYFGEFLNGEINGLGVRVYENGIYFGQWKNGKNEGKGSFYWNTGEKFKGSFMNDKIYGRGVLHVHDEDTKDGEERLYEGLWKDENGTGIKVEKFSFEKRDEAYKNFLNFI